MTLGGRRGNYILIEIELIIPPNKGFGKKGLKDLVPPNATL
jgi:FKBP-type peptidyl-prolyl cis-trans isomerase